MPPSPHHTDIDITAFVKRHGEEDDPVPPNDDSSLEETRRTVATALELLKAVPTSSILQHDNIPSPTTKSR